MTDETTEPKPDETPPEEPTEKAKEDTQSLIDKANAVAERLELANKETKELQAKQEQEKVKETLAGKSTAGSRTMSKEEKDVANAKKFLEGTGYDEELFPDST